VPADNHTVRSMRQGFPCGIYQLDIPAHDDELSVYINGVLVFSHNGCCDSHTNVWTGSLNSSSTIEVRHADGGGGSQQQITLTLRSSLSTPTMTNSNPNICTGGSSALTASSSAGSFTSGPIQQFATPNAAINDNATTSSTIAMQGIPTGAVITRIDINFNVTHTWDGDLTFNLTPPGGTAALVVNRVGGGGDNFTNTVLSTNSSTPISGGTAPFTGTYQLLGLPTLSTINPNGNWVLAITDNATGDTGIFQNWNISIYYSFTPTISYSWSPSTGLSSSSVSNPTASPTTTTTYTVSASSFGCTATNTTLVTVVPDPTISVSGATTICNDGFSTANLTATITNGIGCQPQWQISTDNVSFTDISGATSTSFNTGALSATRYYRARTINCGTGCDAATSSSIAITVTQPPGNSSVYGSNTWNIYVYNGSNFNNYLGFATNSTTSEFNIGAFGMAATSNPTVLSGYSGCATQSNDNWSFSAKRQGFPCGVYNVIGRGHDDNVQVFIDFDGNGTFDFTSTNFTCCNQAGFVNQTLWSGTLTSASRVQINLAEGTGDAYVDIDFTLATPAVNAGAIGGITNGTSICSGGDPGNFNANTAASGGTVGTTNGGSFTYSWELDDPGGGTFVAVAATADYDPPTLTTTGAYVYRRRATDQCGNTQITGTITVNVVADPVAPTATKSPNVTTVCAGATLTLTGVTDNGGGTGTCNIEYSANGGTWTTTLPSFAATVGTNTIAIRKNCNGTGCDISAVNTYSWTVVADPVAQTITPSVANGSTLCVGGTVSATFSGGSGGTGTITDTYEFTTNGGGLWSAYTPGNTITATTGMLGTNTIQIRTLRTATGNGCDASAYNTVSFSVNQLDFANLQFPASGTFCVGGALTVFGQVYELGVTPGAGAQGAGITAELGYNTTNTNPNTWTSWQTATFNAAGGGVNNDEYQANLTGLAAGTYYYAYRYTLGGCQYQYGGYSGSGGGFWDGTTNVSGVLTVVADPTISTQPTVTQTICVGASTSLTVAATGGIGAFTYQWFSNTTNSNSGGTSLGSGSGAQTATYTPPTASAGTVYYYCVLSQTSSGCGPLTSNTATVIVVTDPSSSTPAFTNATICVGGSSNVSVTASNGTGTYTYQWQYFNGSTWNNVVNATPAGSTYTNATTATMTIAGISSAASYQYRCNVGATGTGCDVVSSAASTLTVVADPALSTPTLTNASICIGGSTDISTTASGGTGTFSYQWQYSANGSTGWANVATGTPTAYTYTNATTNTLTIATTNSATAATVYYRCLLTTNTPTGAGCDATSANAVLTLVADPVSPTAATKSPNATSVCEGSTLTISSPTGGSAGLGCVLEYRSTQDGGTTFSAPSTSIPVLTANLGGYDAIQIRYNSCATGCDQPTTWVTIGQWTVIADPAISATTQPPNPICVGGSGTFTVTATGGTDGTGAIVRTQQWQYSADGSTGWANVVDGTPTGITYGVTGTATSLSASTTAIPGTYYYRVIVGATGDNCASVTSGVLSMTVVADPTPPTATQSPSTTTVCIGASLTLINPVLGSGGAGTQTFEYSTTGGTPWSTTVPTLNPVSAGNYSIWIRTNSTGSGCGNSPVTTYTWTVVADPTISTQPITSQTVCVSSSPTNLTVAATGGTGTFSYQWFSNTTNSNSGGTNLGSGSGAQTATYTPSTSSAGTVYYYCVITQTGTSCDVLTSNTSAVTVADYPVTTGTTICQGSSGTIAATSSCSAGAVTTITGAWNASTDPTADRPVLGTNSAACGFISPGAVRNYVATPFQVSVTGNYIFEMVNNGSYDGEGYIVSADFTPGLCPGSGGTGTWYRNDSDSGAAGNEPRMGNAADGGAGVLTLTAGVNYMLVSTTYGTTGSVTAPFTWTITPPSGGGILLGVVQWYTAASGGSPIGTGTPFNPVGVAGSGLANTNTPGTYTYYAACSGSPNCRTAATFVINTAATANAGTIQTICAGGSVTLAGSIGGSATTSTWSAPSGTFSNVNSLTSTYTPSITSGTVTLTLTTNDPDGAGPCTAATSTVDITVIAPPVTTGVTICQGGSGTLSSSTTCPNTFVNSGTTISGTWTAGTDPVARRITSSILNTNTCSFDASITRNYVATSFQVSVTGNYVFEMNDNSAYDGMGYIVTGAFVPGTCPGAGTWVRGDDDNGVSANEPRLGASGVGSGVMTLTAGTTYTLISTTYGASSGTYSGTFAWTITPPSGGQIMLQGAGQIEWYTAASGGSPIGTGTPFNPVGVAGSGLANTNTPGTYTYYAACSANPSCRTATTFVINTAATANAGTPQTVCAGGNVTLAGSIGGGATSSTWSAPSGTFSNVNSLTSTYTPSISSGTVTLTLTTNDPDGAGPCTAATSTVVITVTATPTAVAGTNVITCSNSGAVNITAGSSATNNAGVTWTSSGTGTFANATSLTTATYTPSAADILAGSVTLTLTATGNSPCPNATSTKTLTITTLPTASIVYSGSPYCSNGGTASVSLTGTSGGTYSSTVGLSINTSTGAVDLAASTAGTYTVTYTIAASGGCPTVTATTSITITTLPTASIVYSGSPYCSNGGTASVSLTGTSGGTYSSTVGLSIDSSTGAVDLAASTAGTYTVTYTIAAAGGCPAVTATTSITITTLPTASIVYSGSPYCSNGGTASVSLTGTSGGTYSSTAGLSINSSTGAVDLAASTAGTYTVTYTIAAAGGCPAVTATTSITITTLPTASIVYSGSPYCSNGGTASVSLTGTSGGTYSSTAGLSINASTGAVDLAASTAGTYTVTYTIAASGGCPAVTATTSITITTLPTASIVYSGSPYCSNGGTASVSLTGTSGGTYSSTVGLSIDSSTGAVDLAASTAGTYTVTYTIAAAGGCPAVTATTSITITTLPTASIVYSGSPYCSNGGTASVSLTGTSGGTYSSTVGLSIDSSTGAVDLAASTAGTYTVTYTIAAAGGCPAVTATTSITITTLPTASIVYSGSPYCSNGGTASVSLTGTSGGTYSSTAGLSINTSTGAVDLAASTAGTYTVTYTIAAAGGCPAVTATTSITITTLPTASIVYSGSPYCSNGGTASVSLTGTSGGTYSSTVGLSIDSSTGAVDLAASTAGTYTVTYTIAAAGGCPAVTATTSITITTLPTASIVYSGSPYCSNGGTASVSLTGTSGGTYSSTAGLSINASTGAVDLAASTAGTYTVTYTIAAAGGCPAVTATTIITINELLSVTTSTVGVACFGETNGSATANAIGGMPTYTYNWSNSQTTQTITNLSPGTYTVTVTDQNSCSTTAVAVVSEPLLPLNAVATFANETCNELNNGSIDVSVSGGTSPYTYIWSNGANTQDLNPLSAGTYVVTITDNNGCTTILSQTITQPSLLAATISPTNETCNELNNGAATVNVIGGSVPIAYLWSTSATTVSISSLSAGAYSVTVTDTNGCTTSATTLITQPDVLTINAPIVTNESCSAANNGSIAASVNGGTAAYTYTWSSGGGNVPTISGLDAGTYSLTVTDINSCATTVLGIVVGSNPTPSISVANSTSICAGGVANLVASVTNPDAANCGIQWQSSPDGSSWSNISGATGITYTSSALSTTTYYRAIYDCSTPCDATSNTVVITVNAVPSISISGGTSVCVGGDATLTATPAGGANGCSIQWESSPNGTSWTPIPGANASTYTTPVLSVTTYYHATYTCGGDGCATATSASATVTVNGLPSISIQSNP
jgi:subtilisin-like proprotein convertase family protein